MTLRVLGYNVRSLRDDACAVHAVVRACAPDVVCVQEAPRFLRWRSRRAALARECGLVVAAPVLRVGGLALMVGVHVTVGRTVGEALSPTPGLHRRALVAAEVTVRGERYAVASLHLDLDAVQRRRHVDEVLGLLGSFDVPVVLAVDVNEGPDGAAFALLAEALQDAHAVAPRDGRDTYPATAPARRIDAVFVDRRLEVLACGVPDLPEARRASDHLPVLADVRPRPE